MRPIAVVVLCIVSAAAGAAVDHYWNKIPAFGGSNAPANEPSKVNPPPGGAAEVLGDRTRCDVRYQDLKLPASEYRAFFDKCMGNAPSTSK
jgi:hypothetical protein